MKLVRLTLDSYRAFDFADVKIPESGITLIAGSNNSGKTAFLSAIDFVGRGDRYPDERNLATGRPARIEARFRLSADDSSKLLRSTIGHSSFSSTTLQEVSWRFSELRGTLTATEIVTWWSPGDEIVLARITPVESNGIRLETVNVGEGGKRPNFELVNRSETTPGDTNILRTTGFIGELGILGDWLNEWAANTYHFKSLRPGSASDTYPGRAVNIHRRCGSVAVRDDLRWVWCDTPGVCGCVPESAGCDDLLGCRSWVGCRARSSLRW